MTRRRALFERVPAPDVEPPETDDMVRYRLVHTPWFGIYVHRINSPDEARPVPHTHPWPFVSLIVRGGDSEELERRHRSGRLRHRRAWLLRVGSLRVMRATDAHTITALRRAMSERCSVQALPHTPAPGRTSGAWPTAIAGLIPEWGVGA